MRNKPKPDERRGGRSDQVETDPIPYGGLLVLVCQCLSVCNSLCIFEDIRALWSVVYTPTYSISFIRVGTVYREAGADRGYRKAEADLPYSFIYCDLKDNSCSLD